MTAIYEPPSDEQLARFVTVMVHGPGYSPTTLELTRTMLELPELRQGWIDKHREMQEAAWALDGTPSEDTA
jgi:hypothetical protein